MKTLKSRILLSLTLVIMALGCNKDDPKPVTPPPPVDKGGSGGAGGAAAALKCKLKNPISLKNIDTTKAYLVFNNITLSAKATTKSFKQFDGSAFQFILHSPVYRLIGESYRPTVVEAGHLVVPSRWDDPDSIGVPEIIEDQWSMSAKSEALENSEYILHTVELISDSYASKNIEPRTSKIIYKQIIDYKNQQIISIEITNDILAYYDAMGSRTPQVTNLDVRQTLCIEDMSFKEGLDREPQTSN